jgi:hypothetical protein
VEALTAAGRLGAAVWAAIRRQIDMMSQLAYITKELKVSLSGWGCKNCHKLAHWPVAKQTSDAAADGHLSCVHPCTG